jgi:hypothetical protein
MTHTPHAFIIYASKPFSQNLRTPPSLRWDLVDVRGHRFDLRFFRGALTLEPRRNCDAGASAITSGEGQVAKRKNS